MFERGCLLCVVCVEPGGGGGGGGGVQSRFSQILLIRQF